MTPIWRHRRLFNKLSLGGTPPSSSATNIILGADLDALSAASAGALQESLDLPERFPPHIAARPSRSRSGKASSALADCRTKAWSAGSVR